MEIIGQSNQGSQGKSGEDLLLQGYAFRGSEYINQGFALFKKNIGFFIGFTAILFVGNAVLYSIHPRLSSIANLLNPVFMAGYMIIASRLDKDEQPDFMEFFHGFKKLLPFFVAGILMTIFIAIGFVLLVVPGIYLAVSYMMVIPIILFRNQDFWPAMEESRKVIGKKWMSWFVLGILLVLVNILGALALGVGLLVSIPVTYCSLYAAFKDVWMEGEVPEPKVE